MNEGNHRSYTERVSGCERDMLFLAGPVFMCFAVKFCFRLYGLQAFFPLRSLLWYSTQFVPLLSVTAAACADTVFQQCVCVHVPLYTVVECRGTGLVLNTCLARPDGFSPAEEIKRRWDKKLPHGSRLQLKQPHRNSKYHSSPRASFPPPPLCYRFPFYSLQNTCKMHRGLLPPDRAALLLWFPLPSCMRNDDVGFPLSPSLSFDCSQFA